VRRQQCEQEKRLLLISAAGSAGGSAVEKLWRMLDREGRDAPATKESESSIPRSQEEFERMMGESVES
jgi:hypothetical protein